MEQESEEGNSSKHVTLNSDGSFKTAEPHTWTSSSADSFSSSSPGSPTHEINFSNKPNPLPENVPRAHVVGSSKPPPPDYDPNRIPAFVFSRKPVTPRDWSVASNESMFSIHTGDNSVSKDFPVFMMAKSQDLGKLDEVMTNFSSTMLPPVIVAAPAAYTEEETGITKKNSTYFSKEISEDRIKQNMSSNSDGFVDEGHNGHLVKAKTGMKKQKSQLQFPRDFSNAAGRKWLSFFACCSPCSCCSGYCRR